MSAVLILALCTLLPAAPPSSDVPVPSDEDLRRAWEALPGAKRHEVAEWIRLEASYLDTFQALLVRHVLAGLDVDPGLLPEDAPAPFFDPAVHAPRQPIARRRLGPEDSRARRLQGSLSGESSARSQPCWSYDWSAGEIVRRGDPRDPERVFDLALRGLPPEADLARALVEARLDGSEDRRALRAFGHAYTDRAGNVYPGITLYDAWSSGTTIELPDVDALGIVHEVLDDWKRWKAPVPPHRQDELYSCVEEVFRDVRRYRGLREALAAAFLEGSPEVGDYSASLLSLHALWEEHSSDPAVLAPELPGSRRWERFLRSWAKSLEKDEELVGRANGRWATLLYERERFRALVASALASQGALPVTGPEGSGG